jgi:hypothetical protein
MRSGIPKSVTNCILSVRICFKNGANTDSKMVLSRTTALHGYSFKIIFVYSHPELKVIGGITVDTEDNIYVVGHLSNNIHQLYPDGSFNRILLCERHGLWKPIFIHFLKDDSQFLLSNDGGNNVDIYEMK